MGQQNPSVITWASATVAFNTGTLVYSFTGQDGTFQPDFGPDDTGIFRVGIGRVQLRLIRGIDARLCTYAWGVRNQPPAIGNVLVQINHIDRNAKELLFLTATPLAPVDVSFDLTLFKMTRIGVGND